MGTTEHSHDHADANGHSHGPSHYIKIWAVLLVLLIVSVCGPMIGIRYVTLLAAFGIAIVKAVIVATEFMHLKYEKKIITYILLTMLLLMAIFFYGTAPDIMRGSGQNWEKLPIQEAPQAETEHP